MKFITVVTVWTVVMVWDPINGRCQYFLIGKKIKKPEAFAAFEKSKLEATNFPAPALATSSVFSSGGSYVCTICNCFQWTSFREVATPWTQSIPNLKFLLKLNLRRRIRTDLQDFSVSVVGLSAGYSSHLKRSFISAWNFQVRDCLHTFSERFSPNTGIFATLCSPPSTVMETVLTFHLVTCDASVVRFLPAFSSSLPRSSFLPASSTGLVSGVKLKVEGVASWLLDWGVLWE